MRVNRRGVLATWVAGALLLPLGVLTAGPAAAAPETPDLPTINITLPAGVTQSTLDGGSKETVYAPTTIGTEDASGTTYAADDLATVGPVAGEIKGRGNYTWKLAKKPYQIKLDKSRPLLGLPAAKTWVLLANHADASLMRNKLAFDFANSIGMPFSSESRWVDLRINGVYRGNYLLTEKVEVKTNRVELTDAQGVLAELDNNYGTAEDFWFTSGTSKTIFTLKDAKSGVPDPTKGESMSDVAYATTTKVGWDDMKSTINQLDSLLAASTPNWTAISALIDLDSFVKYYFVNELTENPEITSSSIYFYKNGTADKLHAGPVWDYDSAVGNYDKSEKLGAITYSSYTKNAQILRAKGNGWYYQLYRSPQFVQRANALWNSGIAYQANRLPTKIDGYKTQVQASAANNFAKWKILGTPTLLVAGEGKTYATTYSGEVAYLRDWVSKRSAHLQKEYGTVPDGQVPVARREQGLAALRQRRTDLRHRRRGPTARGVQPVAAELHRCHRVGDRQLARPEHRLVGLQEHEPGRHHRQGPAPRGLPAQAHGQPGTQVRHPVPGPRAVDRLAGLEDQRRDRRHDRSGPADRGRPDPPAPQGAAHPGGRSVRPDGASPTPTPPRRRGRAWASPRGDLPWTTIDGQDLT